MREDSPRDAMIGTPTMVLGPLPLNADDHLAGVVSPQQAEERLWRVLEPVDERLPHDDPAVLQPAPDLTHELRKQIAVVADEEPLQPQPLAHEHRHVARS